MNVYELKTPRELLAGNSYAGRGIVIGKTPDGKKAAVAYFIMGRSANSRNRIFTEDGGTVYTRPFDESKVEDPSLIIYAAVRRMGGHLIVTNGDQTDTICEGLARGRALKRRSRAAASSRTRRTSPPASAAWSPSSAGTSAMR